MLHVHGRSFGSKGQRTHRFVAGTGKEREHSTREWLENLLCKSAENITPKHTSLPFIHVLSCEAKALAEEIKSGTSLWKSGWFILYSSSKISSTNSFGCSLEAMAGYLELCVSNEVQPDPLSLFFLTGLARGDCITLLGGDLQQPLTLHAPKSLEDLQPTNSVKLIEGSLPDKARLFIAGIELDCKARSLLPTPDDDDLKGQLLSARIERKDIYAVHTIAKKNPQLVNQLQSVGNLPLARAVNIPSEEMILCMLSLGANINATDREGDTVLFYAISNNTTDVLNLLLERGANPNCPNYQSVTPLIIAIENNKTKAAELLIKYGTDLSWTDEDDTALTLAVNKGQLSVVNCLLQHGADRRSGLSVELVQQARAAGREDIARVLEQALPKEPSWKNFTQ